MPTLFSPDEIRVSSIGEADVMIDHNQVGRVRVLNLFSASTLYPRLGVQLGITLRDRRPTRAGAPSSSSSEYELRDLAGELRLSEHGDAIGQFSWNGSRRPVRSGDSGYESQIQLTCDLDHHRLEQVERWRNGTAPTLWVQLWPTLIDSTQVLSGDIRSFAIRVAREQWLAFYTKAGGRSFEILEILYTGRETDHFQQAVTRLRDARAELAEGDYDRAVALCRHAMEALKHELPSGTDEEPLRALIIARADERRAKEYLGIVSRIKQLSGFAHHEFGSPITYSRAEAQFMIRTTEAIIALIAALTSSGGQN